MNISSHVLIPIIHRALCNGQSVRLTVKGNSMIPFIFNGDEIELIPPQNIGIGSIVLFEYPNKVFAIHRIVKTKRDSFWIRGDSQLHLVGPVHYKKIIGTLSVVYHKRKIYLSNHFVWQFAGLVWIAIFPVGILLLYIYSWLKNFTVRNLKPGK